MQRVMPAPVPVRLTDQAANALLFRRDVGAVRSIADDFLRECERDLDVIRFVRDAQRVEVFIPPPTPIVFEVEPSDFETEI